MGGTHVTGVIMLHNEHQKNCNKTCICAIIIRVHLVGLCSVCKLSRTTQDGLPTIQPEYHLSGEKNQFCAESSCDVRLGAEPLPSSMGMGSAQVMLTQEQGGIPSMCILSSLPEGYEGITPVTGHVPMPSRSSQV